MRQRVAELKETISYNNHSINMYSVPFTCPGTNIIIRLYCATITTPSGYLKKVLPLFTNYKIVQDAAKDYVNYNTI